MQYLSRICGVFFIVLMGLGCDNEAPVSSDVFGDEPAVLAKQQERAAFTSFQAAGPAGARGGCLQRVLHSRQPRVDF